MSKDISFHTQSIRNQNPPEGKKLTSETLSLQFPVPGWTQNPKNWTQKKDSSSRHQDLRFPEYWNHPVKSCMQNFWICGASERASERAKLSREREWREPRKGRPEALSGHGKTTTIPQTVLRGTVIIYASLALPHTIEISPPLFFFSFISVFFFPSFFSLNKNILGKICGILWIGEKNNINMVV